MIAKGLDFPNVTLVGVVAADMTLNLPDYRSVERTFQLITQVAGRAGRADDPGARGGADLRPRALRHRLRRPAGLPRLLYPGGRQPQAGALSAVHGAGAGGVFLEG